MKPLYYVAALFLTLFLFHACGGEQIQDNPLFLKQIEEKEAFMRDSILQLESICGEADFLNIFEYDGSLGPSANFVRTHASPVGAISRNNQQSNRDRFCSGTLIANDLFLTASHCVDRSIVGQYVAFNYQLQPSGSLENQFFYKILEVVEKGYSRGIDYAILRLEGNPGRQFDVAAISLTEPSPQEELTIIQHPNGRPKEIEAGSFLKNNGKWMSYEDVDTEPGSSGSGVLNAKGELVGVHTNGGCTVNGGANYGMNMNVIAQNSLIISKLAGEQLAEAYAKMKEVRE